MNPAIEAIYATGHWLLEQARLDDAASVFRAMALAAPDDARAWLGLGACHERTGQLSVAARLYRAGVGVAREPARCLVAEARALRGAGDDDGADAALEQAERLVEAALDDELPALVRAARRSS